MLHAESMWNFASDWHDVKAANKELESLATAPTLAAQPKTNTHSVLENRTDIQVDSDHE